jgi:hypothetical protein
MDLVCENTVPVIAGFFGGILNLLIRADRRPGKAIRWTGFWHQLQRILLSWSSLAAKVANRKWSVRPSGSSMQDLQIVRLSPNQTGFSLPCGRTASPDDMPICGAFYRKVQSVSSGAIKCLPINIPRREIVKTCNNILLKTRNEQSTRLKHQTSTQPKMKIWNAFLTVVAASAIALEAVAIGDAKDSHPRTKGCWYCKC